MDKDKTELDAFLGDLSNTSSEDLKQSEDTFETKEETVEEPEIEKPLPFNKDPKVQKFIEKEISRRLADFTPEVKETTQVPNTRVDDVLTRLIGNDTPEKVSMIKEFKEILLEGTQQAKAEAIAELESRQNANVQADQEAEEELESAFENIEENFDVDITSNNPIAKKTRQEFVAFVEKIAPKDRNGDIVDYPDMNSAWETFSDIKKSTAQPNRAKDLASRGMRNSAETTSSVPQGRSTFAEAERFIENLK